METESGIVFGFIFARSAHKHSCEFVECVHDIAVLVFVRLVHVVFVQDFVNYCPSAPHCPPMPVVQVTLHPRGLHPLEAARTFHLHEEEGVRFGFARTCDCIFII